MRTTLTLDDALAAQLKQMAHLRQTSFKETVNEALVLGLREMTAPLNPRPRRTRARPPARAGGRRGRRRGAD